MRTGPLLVAVLCGALIGAACSQSNSDQKPAPKPQKSHIIKIHLTVPYGKKVACTDLLDPAKLTDKLGQPVNLVDRSKTDASATSVCRVMLSGKPPTKAEQKRKFNKNGMRLGVLPGDEICTISAFCSFPLDPPRFKERCKQKGDEYQEDLGVPTCIHASQRAEDYAYTFKVIAPTTKCIYRVMGGPSVTDENLVKTCTQAALATITPDNLKNNH